VARPAGLEIELAGASSGSCDCCGRRSQAVWGYVHEGGGPTRAAYFVRWTEGHLEEVGADVDLILGTWGDGTSNADRTAISLRYRPEEDGPGSFMIVDAEPKPILASSGLKRDEVIDTPLAAQAFALLDAIWEQDDRFF
jgi:hypothetical protein